MSSLLSARGSRHSRYGTCESTWTFWKGCVVIYWRTSSQVVDWCRQPRLFFAASHVYGVVGQKVTKSTKKCPYKSAQYVYISRRKKVWTYKWKKKTILFEKKQTTSRNWFPQMWSVRKHPSTMGFWAILSGRGRPSFRARMTGQPYPLLRYPPPKNRGFIAGLVKGKPRGFPKPWSEGLYIGNSCASFCARSKIDW